jgi:hypothetical protein
MTLMNFFPIRRTLRPAIHAHRLSTELLNAAELLRPGRSSANLLNLSLVT